MSFTRTASRQLTGASERITVTNATIGFTVLTLHVLFVLGIAFSSPWHGASAALHPLVLLAELPPPLTSASRGGGIAVDLDLSIAPPRPANLQFPAEPDTEGVIFDAAEADSAKLRESVALGAHNGGPATQQSRRRPCWFASTQTAGSLIAACSSVPDRRNTTRSCSIVY